MYRLLIVDDEPSIVDGLVQHFRESGDLEADLCKAYSASEALDIVKKTKIDLLISDIRMPGRSGIQLVDDVLAYWPSCRIILLTGHSEFEFAHKAIRKQVDNYILKTEGIETIHAAVLAAIGKADEERRNRSRLERAESQWIAAEPLLKKEIFEALLGGERLSDLRHSRVYDGLSLRIDGGKPILMIAGKVDFWEERVSYSKETEIYYAIQSLFADHLPLTIKAESVVHDRSELVWFLQPVQEAALFTGTNGDTNWSSLLDYLKGMLEPVQNGCRLELGISASFVLCNGPIEEDGIGEQFGAMKAAIKQRAALGHSMSIVDLRLPDVWRTEEPGTAALSTVEFGKKITALEKCLEAGEVDGTRESTMELLESLRSDMAVNYMEGLERYYKLLLRYLTYLNSTPLHGKQVNEIRLVGLPMLEAPRDWGEVEARLTKLGETICIGKREQVEKSEHMLIDRIHRFIGDNLADDLSLARIAEVAYFNPSYLSRFYKQATGRNLSDYINETKAKAASKMLSDTQLKVNEIALKLGFESPSYFTSFFRKMVGKTPQEYRDTFGSNR